MSLIYFIFLALAPSLIWLIFFLGEDRRPEPKKMVLKVFFLGMLSTLPIIILGVSLAHLMVLFGLPWPLIIFINAVFVAAITEEIIKYLVVHFSVLKSSECDEPIDLMIYVITAALGFATLENIIFLFPGQDILWGGTPFLHIQQLFIGSVIRFISGTFLHALASGIMGYFLARSIQSPLKRKKILWTGLGTAILLHSLYNFSIIMSENHQLFFWMVPIILITLFIALFICFSKVKKMASLCNFNDDKIKKESD